MLSSLKSKIRPKVMVLFVFILLLLGIFSPTISYQAGEVFFGENSSLYNVRLAQYFFKVAAQPLLGEAPVFAHYQLSRTYFIQGELDTALSEALLELELHPENKRTYYILGLTYGYLNQETDAIVAFTEFIKAYPTSWAARNDLAWLQFRVGDLDGALQTIEPVTHLNNPWVLNTYGTILLNKGNLVEAKAILEKAFAIAEGMSEESWGRAYPGNDPRIYEIGLSGMRESIQENLSLVESKLLSPDDF